MKRSAILFLTLMFCVSSTIAIVTKRTRRFKKKRKNRRLSSKLINNPTESRLSHSFSSFMKENPTFTDDQKDFEEEMPRNLINNSNNKGVAVQDVIDNSTTVDPTLDGLQAETIVSGSQEDIEKDVDELNKKAEVENLQDNPFAQGNQSELEEDAESILKSNEVESTGLSNVASQNELDQLDQEFNGISKGDTKQDTETIKPTLQAVDTIPENKDVLTQNADKATLTKEQQFDQTALNNPVIDPRPDTMIDVNSNGLTPDMHIMSGEEFIENNKAMLDAQNKQNESVLTKQNDVELKEQEQKVLEDQKKQEETVEKKKLITDLQDINSITKESEHLFNSTMNTKEETENKPPLFTSTEAEEISEKKILQKEIQYLKKRNKKLKDQLQSVKYLKHTLLLQKKSLQSAQYNLMQQNQIMAMKQQQQKNLIADLNRKNKTLNKQINYYNQQNAQAFQTQKVYQTKIGETEQLENNYKIKFDNLAKDYQALEAEKKDVEREKGNLEKEQNRLNDELATLKKQVADQDFFKKNIQNKAKELQKKIKRQDSLKKKLADKYDIITNEVKRLNQIHQQLTGVEQQYQTKMGGFSADKEKLDQREKQLKHEKAELDLREQTMIKREKLCKCSMAQMSNALSEEHIDEEYNEIVDDCLNKAIAGFMNIPRTNRMTRGINPPNKITAPPSYTQKPKKSFHTPSILTDKYFQQKDFFKSH